MEVTVKKRVSGSETTDKKETIPGIIFSKKNLISFMLVAIKLATHFIKKSREN